MNKKQIQLIAYKMFLYGKQDIRIKDFNAYFKETFEEVKTTTEEDYNNEIERIKNGNV